MKYGLRQTTRLSCFAGSGAAQKPLLRVTLLAGTERLRLQPR